MKVSLNWLRELCATDLPADELARRLTFAGFEVEGREDRGLGQGADVVAARIAASERIAGSDHLSICQVDDGRGTHQVVCGAQNFRVGDVVPMARPGAVLPGGQRIGRAKLRGVESAGMLCSARELGLSEDHEGLLILPRDTPVGTGLEELLGLPDTVFELNVAPNRPDALSHLGIAREVHALTGAALRIPQPRLAEGRADVVVAGDDPGLEGVRPVDGVFAAHPVEEGVRVGQDVGVGEAVGRLLRLRHGSPR